MYRRIATIITLALLGLMIAGPAASQGVEDWDGVEDPAYDSAETDAANSAITEAQDERDEVEELTEDLDCTLCVEARELRERKGAAEEDTLESVAALVDARAQAIEAAPGEDPQALQKKLDALDTVESYAEDWGPGGDRAEEGEASTAEVEAAQAAVQAQLSDAEANAEPEPEETSASEPTSAPEPTEAEPAAPPPPEPEPSGGGDKGGNGGGGGDDSGGQEPPPSGGGPLAGMSITTLLAAGLIAVGVAYYLVGLVREGLGGRAKKIGAAQTASAPRQKPSKPKPKPKPAPEPEAEPEPGPPTKKKPAPKEPLPDSPGPDDRPSDDGDSSAIADRLRRMREQENPGGEAPGDSPGTTPEDLNDFFWQEDGEEEDDDEDR